MAGKYLGPAFDIHGGGVDLRFPHHENEQAQSRAAGHPFASYWMHNAWITTEGEKMSKSLGNSLLVPKVLERVRGIELRFYMVSAHYRSTSSSASRRWRRPRSASAASRPSSTRPARRATGRRGARRLRRRDGRRPRHPRSRGGAVRHRARGQPGRRRGPVRRAGARHARRARPRPGRPGLGQPPAATTPPSTSAVDALVAGLLEQRAEARAAKDFARADVIRDQIKAAGIEVEDTPTGPTWSLSKEH